MTANPTEVLTEREAAYLKDARENGTSSEHVLVDTIDRLCSEIVSLRSSRDGVVLERDAYFESRQNLSDEIHKIRADRDAARAEVSRLSGELAPRPAKELVEAATMARDCFKLPNGTFRSRYNISDSTSPAVATIHALDSALSQASSADALSAPAKDARPLQNPPCPKCGKPLHRVRNVADSMLNDEQFDSVKAGDWYCDSCPDNGRGKSACCYFWDRELPKDALSPAPVAAPASAVSPASEEKDAKKIMCDTCGQVVSTDRAEVINTELYSNLVRCISCQTKYPKKAAPEPAPAEASEEKDAKGEAEARANAIARQIADIDVQIAKHRKDRELRVGIGVYRDDSKLMETRAALLPKYRDAVFNLSPTPAPAPSEEYPGVRVYQSQDKTGTWVVRQDLKELRSKVERIGAALDAMKGGANG